MTYRQEYSASAAGDLTALLQQIQQVSAAHASALGHSWEALNQKGLFWAIIRHRLELRRLPAAGETVILETWPIPTSRTCYPRATAGYSQNGDLLFCSTALWVLMDKHTRAMVLPGKSGVAVEGTLTGLEAQAPGSLPPVTGAQCRPLTVSPGQLDENGHINNARYLDFLLPLIPADRTPKTVTLCYLAEAREGQELTLSWIAGQEELLAEIHRERTDVSGKKDRIFGAKLEF